MLKKIRELAELVPMVARRFREDRCLQTGASLTFTTLLSLVPVVTVALTLMTAFPVFGNMSMAIEDFIFDNMMPDSVDVIENYADQFVDNAAKLTAVGIAFLAVTAIMVLITIDDAFNAIWRVHRQRPLAQRVVIYWTLITIGPLLIGASLTLTSWVISVSQGWVKDVPYASVALIKFAAMLLTSLALALLYFALPNRYVKLTDALIGGVLAGVVFELTKRGFGVYVAQFPTYKLVYGAFAAVPVFLLWVYLSWLVVLLGAVVVAALPEWRRRSAKGGQAPGSNFVYALQILKVLWQAQQKGEVVTLPRLHGMLNAPYERIESILDSMQRASWISRSAPVGWVLHRNPDTIAVADVYRMFVFDPQNRLAAASDESELVTLALEFGNRIGEGAEKTVASLFGNNAKETVPAPENAKLSDDSAART